LQTKKFKAVQLNALGASLEPGHLHPLLKVFSLSFLSFLGKISFLDGWYI
jgi:hypothetical protein